LLLEGPLAPLVLNKVACSVLSAPWLLPELCRLVQRHEARLLPEALPHAIGPLCGARKLGELKELARILDVSPDQLFTAYAHHAYAYAFWRETRDFNSFVDALMDEQQATKRVLGNVVMARIVTKEIIIMAGEPQSADWARSASLEPPPEEVARIQTFMQAIAVHVADRQSDDLVAEFLVGDVTAALFERFGKSLSPQAAAAAPAAGGG
ncbi:hypothetical protein Agub_g7703, partial [Astrephomene gubernaculifera]